MRLTEARLKVPSFLFSVVDSAHARFSLSIFGSSSFTPWVVFGDPRVRACEVTPVGGFNQTT